MHKNRVLRSQSAVEMVFVFELKNAFVDLVILSRLDDMIHEQLYFHLKVCSHGISVC
jgi:hypothetical protein